MKVFIIAALTVDGFIGRTADHLSDWTAPEDKKLFVRLTKEAGAMVFGSRTFATIGQALPGRRNIVLTSKPDTVTAEGIETTQESPAELVRRLQQEGANGLAVCGGAAVYTQFMQAGMVDELYLTVEPVVFGTGIPLFNAPLEAPLALLSSEKLNDNTILLHYTVKK